MLSPGIFKIYNIDTFHGKDAGNALIGTCNYNECHLNMLPN